MTIKDERVEFIRNVQPGDRIAVGARGSGFTITKVERLTKTQIITESGGRYRRTDGTLVTSDIWNGGVAYNPEASYVVRAMAEDALRLQATRVVQASQELRADSSAEQIAKVRAALDRFEMRVAKLAELA